MVRKDDLLLYGSNREQSEWKSILVSPLLRLFLIELFLRSVEAFAVLEFVCFFEVLAESLMFL